MGRSCAALEVMAVASDIKLEDDGDAEWVVIEGTVLKCTAADLMMDSPARRRAGGGPRRRALVHDHRDGLTINYNGDYPGGVNILGARMNLMVVDQDGGDPVLPKEGQIGDLLLLVNTLRFQGQIVSTRLSLWVCAPSGGVQSPNAFWQEIKLGDPIMGTGQP